MNGVLKKIRSCGLTPQNVLSYAAIRMSNALCGLWGRVRLRVKAALLGVEVGRGVRCCGPVILGRWPGSRIRIGHNVSIISTAERATAAAIYAPTRLRTHGSGACIELAEGVELTGVSITARSTSIRIGKHAMLAPNCVIVDSDFHAHWPPERRSLDPGLEHDAPVHIGDNVWIGMSCIILKGVSIGEGAIVAAGSVVTRSVPPRVLAAGVPARVVRRLDPLAEASASQAEPHSA